MIKEYTISIVFAPLYFTFHTKPHTYIHTYPIQITEDKYVQVLATIISISALPYLFSNYFAYLFSF